MKRKVPWLLLIFILGAGLRLVFIDSRSIQYDDAFSMLLADRSLPEIVRGTAADTMPPLFYFLLHFWRRYFPGIAGSRLLSGLLSLFSIYLVYLISSKVSGDKRVGLAASFIMSISPLQVYHSQDVRMYALVLVFELVYLYCFVLFDQIEDWHHWWRHPATIGMVLGGAGALYSHNLAGFGLIIPNLYLLIQRKWKKLGQLIGLQIAILALFAPWLVFLPGQLSKVQTAFWTPRPGLVEIIQAITMFVATLPLPGIWLWIGILLSLQVFVLLGWEIIRLWQTERDQRAAMIWFSIILLAPPAVLFILSYLIRPVFVPRGFLISSIGLYGLAGLVIAKRWHQAGSKILIGLCLSAALISLPYQQTFREFPRSPFAEAAEYLRDSSSADMVIVNDNKLSHFPLLIYAPDLTMKFLADTPGSANDTLAKNTQLAMGLISEESIQAAADSTNKIRFVVFEKTVQEYQIAGQDHPVMTWLEANYALEGRIQFGDLEIFTYVR